MKKDENSKAVSLKVNGIAAKLVNQQPKEAWRRADLLFKADATTKPSRAFCFRSFVTMIFYCNPL